MPGNDAEICPACGASAAGDAWCSRCGLDLHGLEARELHTLASRLAAAEENLERAWAHRDALAKELGARRWARRIHAAPEEPEPSRGWQPPAATTRRAADRNATVESPRAAGEWSVDRVRNLLLWAGATLLALSALAFTAVAWTHLGPGGRAALLVALTVLAAIGATAARDRLPATSGALTGLAIALALIDWQIARRAGVAPGLSGAAWWAFGAGIIGGASFALGQCASRSIAYRAAAVLLPLSAVLALVADTDSTWAAALGFSLLAAALIGVLEVDGEAVTDGGVRGIVRAEAITSWCFGAVFVLDAAMFPEGSFSRAVPAAVMLTFAIAPAIVLVLSPARDRDRTVPASLVLAAGAGAALTLASEWIGALGVVTLAAVLGTGLIGAMSPLGRTWRRAARWTGGAAIVPGAAVGAYAALIVETGPLAWLSHAWTGSATVVANKVVTGPDSSYSYDIGWCAVALLITGAVAAALLLRPSGDTIGRETRLPWWAASAALLLVAGAMVPIAAGASVGVSFVVVTALLAAALLAAPVLAREDGDGAPVIASLALLPALPAAGWGATTAGASISVLAAVVVTAAVAALVARVDVLRIADAVVVTLAAPGLAAVILLAGGATRGAAGWAAALVAGVFVVAGAQLLRDSVEGVALEVTGTLALAVAALLAASSPTWLAATLTIAVPVFIAAALRRHRTMLYGIAAACAALAATWAWLGAAHVTVVEAYTLPAAALALGLGAVAHRDGPAHSWLTLGPAVILALAPTLEIAVANNDDRRAIAVGIAALVIVLAGAYRRLQAPIVLGTAALVVLGVEKLGPTAVRLPRWLMLAFAGSVLLWVGTTFERRRDDAIRAARRFEQLG